MLLKNLKLNPDNPQKFDDLSKLMSSLSEFPEMLQLRPIIYDPATMFVLGGNKRLIALMELGWVELNERQCMTAGDLTEDQKKRFIVADNVGFGEWDWESLEENYDFEDLDDWGLELPNVSSEPARKSDSFETEMNLYNDDNCKLPIVPEFFEKHECFIIVVDNEIDRDYVRDQFDLNRNFISESGDKKKMRANLITMKSLRDVING